MKKQTIRQFFTFLEKKEKRNLPFLYKVIFSPESLTKEDLLVDGNLILGDISIKTLPGGLIVKGYLDLENSLIEFLPEKLTVHGSLILTNAVALKELPDNLTVEMDLWIDHTYIMDVPKNLRVEEDLLVGNSNILAKYGTVEAVEKAIQGKGGYVGGRVLETFDREDGDF